MSQIPFQKFKGFLRQMQFEDLNEIGLFAMQKGFTGFLDIPKPTEKEVSELIERNKARGINYDKLFYVQKNPRRFAGDYTLPKSRYFSVCKNKEGNDNNTLQSELYAYYRPKETGYVTIADLTDEIQRTSIINSGLPDTKGVYDIQLLFIREIGKPFIFDVIDGIDEKIPYVMIGIPLRIDYHEIDNEIDLRDPYTAEWFAQTMSHIEIEVDGKNYELNPLRGKLKSFDEILPTIMTQEIGGQRADNMSFTSQVGVWMRLNKVNALIYPSARNNSYVQVKKGEVTDFGGWNLVDYRNSAKPFFNLSFDFTSGWAKQFGLLDQAKPIYYPKIEFVFEHTGVNAGSWKIDGFVGLKQAIIRNQLKEAGYNLPW